MKVTTIQSKSALSQAREEKGQIKERTPQEPMDTVSVTAHDSPGFVHIWGRTIVGAAVGAGAGLYAGLHGGVTGSIAGGVAGGLGGLVCGTAGSALAGLDAKSLNAALATAGVLGAVGGAVAGYAGHLGSGVLLAVAGASGGALIGLVSGGGKGSFC